MVVSATSRGMAAVHHMTGDKSERVRALSQETLELAVELVRRGEIIVIPTDTVYGVACDPFNEKAIEKIFQAKRRPHTKALQVLLPSVDSIAALSLNLPEPLDVLSRSFLPGAFSPICVAQGDCRLVTVHDDGSSRTQGVRVPDFEASRLVLQATGPLAASSANRSGLPSAQTVQDAFAQLGDSVSLYIDAGPTPGPVASTVVSASETDDDGIKILRIGVIPEAVVRQTLHDAAEPLHRNDAQDDRDGADEGLGEPRPGRTEGAGNTQA